MEKSQEKALEGAAHRTDSEAARLVHELEVHQIQLEMQNNELQQEHARAEALLAQYTELYDFAPTAYFSLDRQGMIRQVNLHGARLLGLDHSALMTQDFAAFVAQTDRPAFNAFLQKVFASPERHSCEVALSDEGRQPLFVRIEGVACKSGQECRAVVLDLTERRQAEEQALAAAAKATSLLARSENSRRELLSAVEDQTTATKALRDNEARFRALIEQSLTGIYMTLTEAGLFQYANPRLEQILGYGTGELVGLGVNNIVIAQDLPIILAERKKLRAGAVSSSYEIRARRKDGSVVELGIQGSSYESGGEPATIGMAQDITERKRAEAEITRYIAELETAFMSTVEVATNLSEMRDPYTAGHERKVAQIAVAIGVELGFNDRRTEGLRVAGFLHDIGKITIPSEILSKPGRLSPIEFKLIQGHPQASHDVLKNVHFPWPIAEIVLQHHERMDGSGYPQGLQGEAILMDARIIAVADVIEAMYSHRPYRAGLGLDKALAEIERGRASVYDAQVVDACLCLFREKGYSI